MKWIAHYNDGTKLEQYENGKENLFGDIKHDKLHYFCFVTDTEKFAVDLRTGKININGQEIEFENFGEQNDFQLIYYRRVRNDLGTRSGGQKVSFNIGWKTKIDNYSFKRVLKLTPTKGSHMEVQLSLR